MFHTSCKSAKVAIMFIKDFVVVIILIIHSKTQQNTRSHYNISRGAYVNRICRSAADLNDFVEEHYGVRVVYKQRHHTTCEQSRCGCMDESSVSRATGLVGPPMFPRKLQQRQLHGTTEYLNLLSEHD